MERRMSQSQVASARPLSYMMPSEIWNMTLWNPKTR